ncbi:MAG: hypothetical protein K8R74_08930 [Bacteroidales bacterium]|nr:hypothetical protein [Bacteroidales bacterium]
MMEFFLNRQQIGSFLTDMSKMTYRYLFCLILIIVVVSCSKNEEPVRGPFFELVADSGYISGSETISPGQLMKFKVVAEEGSEKLTNFIIEVENVNHIKTRYFDTAIYNSEFNWEGSFYKSSEKIERWLFIIRDRKSMANSEFIFIDADTSAAYNPIILISNIQLGAQNNIQNGGFFALSNQTIYSTIAAKEHQEIIDMIFYFGEDHATLASPGANIENTIYPEDLSPLNWGIRNTTRYIKTALTEMDFDNAVNDSIMIANYIDAEGKRKAKELETGDIYSFKTQDAKYGMFLVTEIFGSESGAIKMDIKIQE